MKVRRLFTVCSVLGLVLLAYPALACEFHEEPMGPSDECWSHDDCGQGACESRWLDWDESSCVAGDYGCFEVSRCVFEDTLGPEIPVVECGSDSECPFGDVCALPLCNSALCDGPDCCADEPGVCVSSHVDLEASRSERLASGCQGGGQSDHTMLLVFLFAVFGFRFAMGRAKERHTFV